MRIQAVFSPSYIRVCDEKDRLCTAVVRSPKFGSDVNINIGIIIGIANQLNINALYNQLDTNRL